MDHDAIKISLHRRLKSRRLNQTKTQGIKPGKLPNSIPRANLTKLSNFWGSVHPGDFL
jgi:hypothetical protein